MRRAGIVALGLILGVMLAEIVARRVYSPPPLFVPFSSRFIPAPPGEELIYMLRPGYRTHVYEINEQGFEGPPASVLEDSVIMLLGDSIIFPETQADSESIAGRLRSALPGYAVVDAAVPGYNLENYLQRARWAFRRMPYRRAVLFVAENDMYPPYLERFGGGLRINEQLWATEEDLSLTPLASIRSWFQRHSVLYRLVMDSYNAVKSASPAESAPPEKEDDSPRSEEVYTPESLAVSPDWIERMKGLWIGSGSRFSREVRPQLDEFIVWSQRRGIEVRLVLLPNRTSLLLDEPIRFAAAALENYRPPHGEAPRILDLTRLLTRGSHPPNDLFLDNGHLTARGAELVTQAALDFVAAAP